jgi:hypothetical protein
MIIIAKSFEALGDRVAAVQPRSAAHSGAESEAAINVAEMLAHSLS